MSKKDKNEIAEPIIKAKVIQDGRKIIPLKIGLKDGNILEKDLYFNPADYHTHINIRALGKIFGIDFDTVLDSIAIEDEIDDVLPENMNFDDVEVMAQKFDYHFDKIFGDNTAEFVAKHNGADQELMNYVLESMGAYLQWYDKVAKIRSDMRKKEANLAKMQQAKAGAKQGIANMS